MDLINHAVMLKKRPPSDKGEREEKEYIHPTDRNRKIIPKRCVPCGRANLLYYVCVLSVRRLCIYGLA